MTYSSPLFLSLLMLEPLRNPERGLCPSACAATGRATLRGRHSPCPQSPMHSKAALQTPAGDKG